MTDKLRVKGGIEYRQAILLDQRVEFFRGKDFANYYRDHTSEMAQYVPKGAVHLRQSYTDRKVVHEVLALTSRFPD